MEELQDVFNEDSITVLTEDSEIIRVLEDGTFVSEKEESINENAND